MNWTSALIAQLVLTAILAVSLHWAIHLNRRDIKTIMATISDLRTANDDLRTKADLLVALVNAQNAQIAALQAQIGAGSVDPAALQAIVDDMRATSAKMAAVLPAPTV